MVGLFVQSMCKVYFTCKEKKSALASKNKDNIKEAFGLDISEDSDQFPKLICWKCKAQMKNIILRPHYKETKQIEAKTLAGINNTFFGSQVYSCNVGQDACGLCSYAIAKQLESATLNQKTNPVPGTSCDPIECNTGNSSGDCTDTDASTSISSISETSFMFYDSDSSMVSENEAFNSSMLSETGSQTDLANENQDPNDIVQQMIAKVPQDPLTDQEEKLFTSMVRRKLHQSKTCFLSCKTNGQVCTFYHILEVVSNNKIKVIT